VRAVSESDERVVLAVHVTDTGIGLSDEGRARLFQPFQQADSSTTRKYGGTGLGLAISRQLVQLMGGEMHVVSVFGKGSTFSFTIDVAKTPRPAAAMAPLRTTRGDRVSALVCSSSQPDRIVVRRRLRQWGAHESCVRSVDELRVRLRQLLARGERVDLLMIDAEQMVGDPLQMMHALRQEFGAAIDRLVLLASLRHKPDHERARNAGIDGIVGKPLREMKMFDVLASVLRDGRDEPRKRRQVKRPATIAKSRARILLAEDNPVNQKVAVHMLDRLGYRCDIASNGQEAVAMLLRMPYDLVLMDCQMPEMDGYMATRLIRKREEGSGRRTPIVAMTANAMREDRARCLESGMDGFIPKPIALEELETAMDCWIPDDVKPLKAEVSIEGEMPTELRVELGADQFPNRFSEGIVRVTSFEDDLAGVPNANTIFPLFGNSRSEVVERSFDRLSSLRGIAMSPLGRSVLEPTPAQVAAAFAAQFDVDEAEGAGKHVATQMVMRSEPQEGVTAVPLSSLPDTSVDLSVLEMLRSLEDDGDAFIAGLVATYVSDTTERMAALQKAFAQRNGEALERAAHAIKGSSANIGARRMAELGGALQHAGKAGDFATAAPMIAELEEEFFRTQDHLAIVTNSRYSSI
jgi:CheY-like chemotaxis protein